jgi:hypothetical protein
MTDVLRANLLSPVTLAFALGAAARPARSEFALPRDVYTALSVHLLFALGLKGGVELSHTGLTATARPATATLLLGVVTPVVAYLVLRRLGRFSGVDAAGVAAHYGSVSAVTSIAVRAQLPEANLTLPLTASLAMTIPFNLLVGIPLYCWMAQRVAGAP